MRKQIIVNAMGKRIVIDNPDNVQIMFKEKMPMIFNIDINEKGLNGLKGAFKFLGGKHL